MKFAADAPFDSGDMELDEQGFLRPKGERTAFTEPEPLKHETIGREMTDKLLGRAQDEVQITVGLDISSTPPMTDYDYYGIVDTLTGKEKRFSASELKAAYGGRQQGKTATRVAQQQLENYRREFQHVDLGLSEPVKTLHMVFANFDRKSGVNIEDELFEYFPCTKSLAHIITSPCDFKTIKPGDRIAFYGFPPGVDDHPAFEKAWNHDERPLNEKGRDYHAAISAAYMTDVDPDF